MNLSISNIGWPKEQDVQVYGLMRKYGFSGLEIAPTRIFSHDPYGKIPEAVEWKRKLQQQYGFNISSMQAIWFGRQEKLFGSKEERDFLKEYTKRAIDFAAAMDCSNLVFGCPKNRIIPDNGDLETAVVFFRELGDYAASRGTVLGIEANPPIYRTNFINDTESALALIKLVDSDGFLLNLDVGTMIENQEDTNILRGKIHLINHVHVSEPKLKLIESRSLHHDLALLLNDENYEKYVSIEVGLQKETEALESVMKYVTEQMG